MNIYELILTYSIITFERVKKSSRLDVTTLLAVNDGNIRMIIYVSLKGSLTEMSSICIYVWTSLACGGSTY